MIEHSVAGKQISAGPCAMKFTTGSGLNLSFAYHCRSGGLGLVTVSGGLFSDSIARVAILGACVHDSLLARCPSA